MKGKKCEILIDVENVVVGEVLFSHTFAQSQSRFIDNPLALKVILIWSAQFEQAKKTLCTTESHWSEVTVVTPGKCSL